jgi:hypothetical protein
VIDSGLPDLWPAIIRDAASQFEQGDLVRNPPFFYWASLDHPVWDVTVDAAARDERDPLIALDPGDGPRLGMITTQSCDLDEADPKKPWFHVAPVVGADAFRDDDLASICGQKYGYLHALPPIPGEPGVWVADLRVEFPIEKGWLVGMTPIRCLSSLQECRELARKLGRTRARPALDGPSDLVVQHLRKSIGRMKPAKRAQVLGSLPPDGLCVKLIGTGREVTGLQLYVLSEKGTPGADTRVWFEQWRDRIEAKVPEDFDFLGTVFGSLESLSALAYRDLVQLDFS